MVNPLRSYGTRLRKLIGRSGPDFFSEAVETWQEAPGEELPFHPALALSGQIDRIRSSIFASLPETIEALTRDGTASEGPTMGWRFRNVDLVDGVLYGRGAEMHLRARQNRLGLAFRPRQSASGALYETWTTNRWFGSWLMDELLTWPLAQATGAAFRTGAAPQLGGHAARYEEILGVVPRRIQGDVHFDELILFGDLANNRGKWTRQRQLREKLLQGRQLTSVPGVFLLRGTGGDLRLLLNERQLAERLAAERGFLVLDPMVSTVDEIVAACGAAKAIVGVEGSQLVHGIISAPAGAAIVPIQPPDRVAATLKQISDRLDQRFGLLVAEGHETAFTLDWKDLAATLDLFS
ncbi:glycosyltransferase family 61 protein [Paracoccus aminophilus]|uniref:Glycosyltransferase 61 catalytic domain-containing protein n=1 Tax=Paracoccus aminophilus JCM 7686 TaxID=1367847 RepID=S5Y5W1_PARAH|nr:glycosyltransferase family 61 protein [Paracoccus aminophilus]AGT11070.1 hypothetical protein JCM7686_pAMI5p004 [Paracoccus aminophilus JCM 7686]